mgnify:FL=1
MAIADATSAMVSALLGIMDNRRGSSKPKHSKNTRS